MEEWKEYKIGDVCNITSSKRIFASEYNTFGIPFYRGKEIIEKQRGSSISNELFISEERYKEINAKYGTPSEGDMLLTSVGTLGIPYIVENNEVFYFKDGNLTWFNNFKGINNKYLYYWFLSPKAKHFIDTKAIGSTQKALTIDTLKNFDIQLPSIGTQEKIVSILSSIDSKITLNRRINDNLEQQAQALFKSWFVDFEPFKDGKFVDSELGMIPEGWKVCAASDIFDINIGKTPPRKEQEWFSTEKNQNMSGELKINEINK
jgi:type I restriction enzyme S subunit